MILLTGSLGALIIAALMMTLLPTLLLFILFRVLVKKRFYNLLVNISKVKSFFYLWLPGFIICMFIVLLFWHFLMK